MSVFVFVVLVSMCRVCCHRCCSIRDNSRAKSKFFGSCLSCSPSVSFAPPVSRAFLFSFCLAMLLLKNVLFTCFASFQVLLLLIFIVFKSCVIFYFTAEKMSGPSFIIAILRHSMCKLYIQHGVIVIMDSKSAATNQGQSQLKRD